MKNEKKVFITGVNGFIGRNLCKFLINKKFTVYGIDNFFSSKQDDLKELKNPNFHFKEKSILDDNIYDFVKDKIDIVIHLAAQTSVFKSLKDPLLNNLININGFENIFYQSKRKNIKNFFFTSSSSVYGDNKKLPLSEDLLGLKPLSPYAESKLKNEFFLKKNKSEVNTIGLRLFNMYGSKQENYSSNYAAVIPKWINNIRKNKSCQIYGDGKSLRDFCHIDDLCDFFLLLIENQKKSGIYNFCSNKPCSIENLFYKIIRSFNDLGYKVKYPEPDYIEEVKGDIKFSYGCNRLLKKIFNFQTKITLDMGLRRIIK